MLPNKVFDILKWVAIIVLPALGACIQGIFAVWGIPHGTEIAETLKYLSVFLGAVLGVSAIQYKRARENGEIDGE
jgi:hypothetical protein